MKKSYSKIVILLLAFQFLYLNLSPAQSVESCRKRIDSVMNIIADRDSFTGTILVADKGKVIYQNAFGYSDYATKKKLTVNSLFEIASVTKQFTAMGIMILKERGKLSYEDNIQKYFPNLPYINITIRHLLNHTSGLPKYESFMDKKWDKSKIAVNDDIWKLFELHKPPVEFNPGEKWAYSNTGYAMLASIIERASGKTYKEFLKENIFDKLEMKRTRIINRRLNTETLDDYAYGYVFSLKDNGFILPDNTEKYNYVIYLDGIVGDGCVNSTVEDLYKWDRALYTEKPVKQSTLDEAFTSGKINNGELVNYGFGWSINSRDNLRKISHSGGWPGYATIITRFPDIDRTIIILSINQRPVDVTEIILNILDNKQIIIPKANAALQVRDELIKKEIIQLRTKIESIIDEKSNYQFNEGFINTIGYELLEVKRIEEAIEIFNMNVKLFPNSANTYDSLAEAYAINGDIELAIANYEKALALNPKLDSAREALKKLKGK